MRKSIFRRSMLFSFVICIGCGVQPASPPKTTQLLDLRFTAEVALGTPENNPSTPFLRYSPDGTLIAVWTEDHDTPWPAGKPHPGHGPMTGDRAPSPMRNAFMASS